MSFCLLQTSSHHGAFHTLIIIQRQETLPGSTPLMILSFWSPNRAEEKVDVGSILLTSRLTWIVYYKSQNLLPHPKRMCYMRLQWNNMQLVKEMVLRGGSCPLPWVTWFLIKSLLAPVERDFIMGVQKYLPNCWKMVLKCQFTSSSKNHSHCACHAHQPPTHSQC